MVINYWNRDGDNENTLRGVPGDPDNPVRLDDDFIIFALRHSIEAKAAFETILPSLLPEEQARLQQILDDHPDVRLVEDPQDVADVVQRRQNTMGIYTTGPRGGGN